MKKLIIFGGAAVLILAGAALLRAQQVQTLHPIYAPEAISPAALPTIGTPVATPSIIAKNTPTTVTVTTQITDTGLIPSSVNLLRLGATSTQPTILGKMHDDGLNGDALAGDHIYTLLVLFNEPSAGQIQLEVSAAFRGQLRRAISKITQIAVWNPFASTSAGITFSSPQFVSSEQIVTIPSVNGGPVRFDIQVFDPSSEQFVSLVGISIYRNSSSASLQQWFESNVDVNGILAVAGTFQQRQLANGFMALVLVGPVPRQYLAVSGPVDQIYMISPTGDRVVSITQAQEQQVGAFGYDWATLSEQILETLQFH